MKRFKRPISEVAKGLFHQSSGDSKPIIPNLGVNSKKAAPTKMTSPAKDIDSDGNDRPLTAEQQAAKDAKNKVSLAPPKGKTQSEKNAETRKSGKAVSYKDAYADADKKKYDTYEKFEKAAKEYNTKKYGTTNPTADSKKAGKTKAQLAKDVAAKNKPAETTKPAVETTKPAETTKPVETKAEKITAKGDAKVERIKARKAKRTERKANRAANKAARKESRAKVRAARKGEVEAPAKKKKY